MYETDIAGSARFSVSIVIIGDIIAYLRPRPLLFAALHIYSPVLEKKIYQLVMLERQRCM